MSILTLEDPFDSIRKRFRAVWCLYYEGSVDSAESLLDEIVSNEAGRLMDAPFLLTEAQLQEMLMEEKRRYEDVNLIADIVVRRVEGLTDRATTSPNSGMKKVTHTPSPVPEVSVETVEANKDGGLDIAGLIDSMLESESH